METGEIRVLETLTNYFFGFFCSFVLYMIVFRVLVQKRKLYIPKSLRNRF